MSGQKFGGQAPSGNVPLCERDPSELTEEQKALLVNVDALYASASGNLSDSIWAPGNEKLLVAKRLKSQVYSTKGWVPKKDMAGAASSRWGPADKPLVSSTQPSLSGAAASFSPSNGAAQGASAPPPHLRPVEPKPASSIPPHLRGMGRYVPPSRQSVVVAPAPRVVEAAVVETKSEVLPIRASSGSLPRIEEHKVATNAPPAALPQAPQREDTFQAYIAKKAALDLAAKQKSLARKAFQPSPATLDVDATTTPDSPGVWATPESNKPIGRPFHSHFTAVRPDQGVDNFQQFLRQKNEQEAVGGKRYVEVTQPNEQHVVAAPPKFGTPDPHAVFSPPTPISQGREVSGLQNTIIHPGDPVSDWGNVVDISSLNNFKAEVSPSTTRQMAVLLEQAKSSVGQAPQVEEADERWPITTLETNPATMNQSILQDIRASTLPQVPLTKDAIIEGWGSAPREDYANSFEGHVSDTGVEALSKENIRGTQGRAAADELLDWDKSWLPPPCDWEGRGIFDTGFMKEYIITDWEPKVGQGPVHFPMDHPDFYHGRSPVNNFTLDAPIQHQDTIADVQNSENEEKRLSQTAQIELMSYTRKMNRSIKKAIDYEEYERLTFVPPPNPFAPTIDIHLRPAIVKDVPGICAIYNYYVISSHVTEDHKPVTEADIKMAIETCRKEELPFIVAVMGNMPAGQEPRVKNKIYPAAATKPAGQAQSDTVVGFAFAQAYSYGIAGVRTGRSRTTADVQFYVGKEFTRKGVGRCLLDRITQCMSFGYAAKEGYSWMNPGDNKVYKSGGVHYIHQLIIHLTVLPKNDPNLTWMTAFLMKYWYMDEGKIERVGRTSVELNAVPEFLDVIFFCNEAMPAAEFNVLA